MKLWSHKHKSTLEVLSIKYHSPLVTIFSESVTSKTSGTSAVNGMCSCRSHDATKSSMCAQSTCQLKPCACASRKMEAYM